MIKIYIETDPNLPSIPFKPYTLPLKHQGRVRKELEELEKAGIIQRHLSSYAVPNIPTVHGNKSSGMITLVDISKIEKHWHECMDVKSTLA